MKQLLTMAFCLVLCASLLPSGAQAQTSSISLSGCTEVQLTVRNVNTATGWGGHLSIDSFADGFGGFEPECHITPDSNDNLRVLCYDGYLSSTATQDEYRLDLGPRAQIESVTYTVAGTGVKVVAVKKSTTGFTSDRNGYVVEGFFPLRRDSGFCRGTTLYYRPAGGVLSGLASRSGSGYAVTAVRF